MVYCRKYRIFQKTFQVRNLKFFPDWLICHGAFGEISFRIISVKFDT